MKRQEATALIAEIIESKKVKYQELADAIGSSLIWTIHALNGQAKMDQASAEKVGNLLELTPELVASLQQIPLRSFGQTVPEDHTLYRLTEMMQSYGPDIKIAINELFGDGAMSGIDFKLGISKVESSDGDRVQLVLDGKFLPFNKF